MVVAAAEECAVGYGGQRNFHLGLGLVEVLQVDAAYSLHSLGEQGGVLRLEMTDGIVVVGGLGNSHEQLVAVGYVLRRYAGGKSRQQDEQAEFSVFHVVGCRW